MPGTTIAIYAAASAGASAAASAEAHRARIAECNIEINQFNAQKATVAEKQEYASCVNEIYPDPMSPHTVIFFKVMFVAALLGMAFGVIKSKEGSYWAWEDAVMYGFVGLLLPPLAMLAVAGIYTGVVWLFN